MNRRSVLAAAGSTFGSATAGCLGDSDTLTPGTTDPSEAERRDAACSHVPADADRLQYETAILRHDYVPLIVGGGFHHERTNEETTPFALVSTDDEVETRLRPDALDAADTDHSEIRSFIGETDFETEVLLVWQTRTASGGYHVDVVGITRPENDSIRAYTCRYHDGGANGTAVTPYTIVIRVAVPRRPERAKLIFRSGHSSGTSRDTTTYEDYRNGDETEAGRTSR